MTNTLTRIDDTSGEMHELYKKVLDELGVPIGMPDHIGKLMRDEHENLRQLIERASRDEAFIRRWYAMPLNRIIAKLLDPLVLSWSTELDYRYGSTSTLTLRVSVDTIKQAMPIIRLLCVAEGMKIDYRPTPSADTKSWAFIPRAAVADTNDNAIPRLWLHVSAKRCKRVQVGEQTIPKFETVCEWGEDQGELAP